MKKIIKALLPPIVFDFIKKVYKKKYGWLGEYDSYEEVEKLSKGYNQDNIINTVKNSLLRVKNNQAVYERDSVVFEKIHYSWALLSGLMYVTLKSHNKLDIIDFGGSLGSTYYQNRVFLDRLEHVSWNIVEQEQFVNIGRKEFEDARLKFYYSVEEAKQNNKNINVILLSSVLQYISSPYELLDEMLQHDFKYILFDRTAFSKNKKRVTLQVVPPHIYEASYPCWFFDEREFKQYFEKKNFYIIEEFEALDGESDSYIFKGFIMEKKDV